MIGNRSGPAMKLDKNRVLELMAAADTKWYGQHPPPTSHWSYREHLEFTADYIAKNYNRKSKQGKVRSRNESNKVYRLL
jgi:hypothetical protein